MEGLCNKPLSRLGLAKMILEAAQKAFSHRAVMNMKAAQGQWNKSFEG